VFLSCRESTDDPKRAVHYHPPVEESKGFFFEPFYRRLKSGKGMIMIKPINEGKQAGEHGNNG
jgi:hypothetical protein